MKPMLPRSAQDMSRIEHWTGHDSAAARRNQNEWLAGWDPTPGIVSVWPRVMDALSRPAVLIFAAGRQRLEGRHVSPSFLLTNRTIRNRLALSSA